MMILTTNGLIQKYIYLFILYQELGNRIKALDGGFSIKNIIEKMCSLGRKKKIK